MTAVEERPHIDLSAGALLAKEQVAELLAVKPSTVAELARCRPVDDFLVSH